MEYSVIENVYIHPSELTCHLDNVISKLVARNALTTTEKYGFILNVSSQHQILDTFIDPGNDNIMMVVEYRIKAIKPKIGTKYSGKISGIYNEGICSSVDNIVELPILIPGGILKDDVYQFPCKCRFKMNDEINFVISEITFKNKQYTCVGKHACD